jgi:hypothetical protein
LNPVRLFPFPVDFVRKTLYFSNFLLQNRAFLAKIKGFEAHPVKLFPFPVDFVRKTLKISNFLLRNRVKP